ncbi:MAG: sugar ABC transporter permease [Oscillospiraceae bacterium]|nr:sugar ABC transporter permease [Oscillospiraceae bacterium]
MAKSPVLTENSAVYQTGFQKFCTVFVKNWQLHLMILLPFAYLLLFHYAPMYGLQIAFRHYSPKGGITNSDWVGFGQFADFFSYYLWGNLIWNTLALSLYQILAGFPIPVVLALVIHVNTYKGLKKVAQNVSYIPHFISVVIMVGILNTVLNPISGMLGAYSRLTGTDYMSDIRGSNTAFRHLYVWSGIWQTAGWSTIIYVSALSAVPDELHEAAKLDGASRLRRVWSVDLPTIMPTVAIMLIMRFGSVMSVGYQKAYLMQNSANLQVSEIISTYVYKKGLAANNLSYGSAVGLMNSVVNTTMVVVVNWITNRLTDNEMGLF